MKKGFIQIPILIAIVAGIIVISGASYVGITKYKQSQSEKDRVAQEELRTREEQEKQTLKLIADQQKALEETRQELNEARTVSQKTQEKVSALEKKVKTESSASKDLSIQSRDLTPYLSGVVEISCGYTSGSGSLWKFKSDYFVFTNAHVVKTPNSSGFCSVTVVSADDKLEGLFVIYPDSDNALTGDKDFTVARLVNYPSGMGIDEVEQSLGRKFKTIPELNYKISELPLCSKQEPIGLSIIAVGYPAFAEQNVQFQGLTLGSQSSRSATNGIISGYDSSKILLANKNYFVSAKIDSGNSGGIAFAKNDNGLCVLGIPTWLSLGHYETQGMVQNIHNVFSRDQ